jgi:hypothetical protein
MSLKPRISILAVFFSLTAIAQCGATASAQPTTDAAQAARELLREGGFPVLFVGKVVDVDSSDCSRTGYRNVRYSVGNVFFGFAPPDPVKVGYRSCKKPSTKYPPGTDLVVLANYDGQGFGLGREQLVWRPTQANIKRAQSLLNEDAKRRIERFMRHSGRRHNNQVVAFEGTLFELPPKLPEPTVCRILPTIRTKYDVQDVIHGELADKQIVVNFSFCGNLPDPPFRVGQRMIVLAISQESHVHGDLRLVFAPEQLGLVKSALHPK